VFQILVQLTDPCFYADEDNHDMHKRLMRSVEDGEIKAIDMCEEHVGLQDNTFVRRKASKKLMEQISYENMAGPSILSSS
jgi:hypothetical protein